MEITFKVTEFSQKFPDIFAKLPQLERMSIKSGIMKTFSAFNRILNNINNFKASFIIIISLPLSQCSFVAAALIGEGKFSFVHSLKTSPITFPSSSSSSFFLSFFLDFSFVFYFVHSLNFSLVFSLDFSFVFYIVHFKCNT